MNAEQQRLAENNSPEEPWHFWGPYLAERAWGTVREDYSANGDPWDYFPHDHARSRAYRWNEDGIGGICDRKGRLCFAFAFWNERDPFLKERFFGVSGPQGNHGEDVKELYWYIDNTPSHSFMRMAYRYPQTRFAYEELVAQSGARSKMDGAFDLWDTGAFDGNFFDIEIEYAKATPNDILICATATNCGPEPATLHLLPTIWFRNTWSWGRDNRKPNLRENSKTESKIDIVEATDNALGRYAMYCENADEVLFTENETNTERLWALPNPRPFVKDSINDCVVQGKIDIVNPQRVGTKAAAHYKFVIAPNEAHTIRLRLTKIESPGSTGGPPDLRSGSPRSSPSENAVREARSLPREEPRDTFSDFDKIFLEPAAEADEFYGALAPSSLGEGHRAIQRQGLSGFLL